MRIKHFICLLIFLNAAIGAHASDVKAPNVAGTFYPSDKVVLSEMVDGFLNLADVKPQDQPVGMLIAPHAGYIYSGPVAAFAYRAASQQAYKTVVILAPSHYFPFDGAIVWGRGGFKTPLGELQVDEAFIERLRTNDPLLKEDNSVFEKEHALEVQLPFIARQWPYARIVPILMGQPNLRASQSLAQALDKAIGSRNDVLVIISTDLAHYHAYDENNAIDSKSLDALLNGDVKTLITEIQAGKMEMCGFVPVMTGMMFAERRGLEPHLLKHANSADTQGNKDSVVGYAALVYTQQNQQLNAQQQEILLRLARESLVAQVLRKERLSAMHVDDPRLKQVQGAFVTLKKDGQLRGCIGNIIGQEPLADTVIDMAIAAASSDPRFEPVRANELKDIDVEVSVLSVPKKVNSVEEIIMGEHGVIISDGKDHQGVFLPQVADETGWSRDEFLTQLAVTKAGLSAQAWKDPAVSLFIFSAQVFGEKKHAP